MLGMQRYNFFQNEADTDTLNFFVLADTCDFTAFVLFKYIR